MNPDTHTFYICFIYMITFRNATIVNKRVGKIIRRAVGAVYGTYNGITKISGCNNRPLRFITLHNYIAKVNVIGLCTSPRIVPAIRLHSCNTRTKK